MTGSGEAAGGAYCQSPSGRPAGPPRRRPHGAGREVVRQLPVRCSLLRVAGRSMRDSTPTRRWNGRKPYRGRRLSCVTGRHLGLMGGRVEQDCEHRCRRSGLGARAAAPETPGAADADARPADRGRTVRVRNRLVVGVAVVGLAVIAAGRPRRPRRLRRTERLPAAGHARRAEPAGAHPRALARRRARRGHRLRRRRARPDGGKAPASKSAAAARVDRQVDELRGDAAPAELRRDLDRRRSRPQRAALTGKGTRPRGAPGVLRRHRRAARASPTSWPSRLPPRAAAGARRARRPRPRRRAGRRHPRAAARRARRAGTEQPDRHRPGHRPARPVDRGLGRRRRAARRAQRRRPAGPRPGARRARRLRRRPRPSRPRLATTPRSPAPRSAPPRSTSPGSPTSPSSPTADRGTDREEARRRAHRPDRPDARRRVLPLRPAAIKRPRAAARRRRHRAGDPASRSLGGLLLLAVGVSTAVARTLTRPLAVLRLGAGPARRPTPRPRSRSASPAATTSSPRSYGPSTPCTRTPRALARAGRPRWTATASDLVGAAAEAGRRAASELRAELAELDRPAGAAARTASHGTFVNLSLRTLGLVERQLGVIEGLEEREQDPDRLATLFKLDHFATGHAPAQREPAGPRRHRARPRHTSGPVPLVDVVRAAVSEIERYERVRIQSLPPHAQVAGLRRRRPQPSARRTPGERHVVLAAGRPGRGLRLAAGERRGDALRPGRGHRHDRRPAGRELNAPPRRRPGDRVRRGAGRGRRWASGCTWWPGSPPAHGVRVQLREQKQGGIAAVVVLPETLLASATRRRRAHLGPGRRPRRLAAGLGRRGQLQRPARPYGTGDPLVELAESAVRDSERPARGPLPAPTARDARARAYGRRGRPCRRGDGRRPAHARAGRPRGAGGRPSAEAPAPDRTADPGPRPVTARRGAPPAGTPASHPGHEDRPHRPSRTRRVLITGTAAVGPGVRAEDRGSEAVAGIPRRRAGRWGRPRTTLPSTRGTSGSPRRDGG